MQCRRNLRKRRGFGRTARQKPHRRVAISLLTNTGYRKSLLDKQVAAPYTLTTSIARGFREGLILTTLHGDETYPEVPVPTSSDNEPMFPREGSPSKLGGKKEFGNNLKRTTWELANEFSSTSNLRKGMYKSQAPNGENHTVGERSDIFTGEVSGRNERKRQTRFLPGTLVLGRSGG